MAVFSAAWRCLPPRIFQRRHETAFQPYGVDFPQTLTDGGKSRAARAAALQLGGELTAGDHPMSAVIRQICPATMQALHQAAQSFEPGAALAAACAEVERAFNDRFTAVLAIEASAAAPWEQDRLQNLVEAAEYQEAMTRTRVAELLAECLLYQQPNGHLVPDRRDVHRLLDHAHAALEGR